MATFLPLGDQAVLAYLPDESAAGRFAATARAAMQPEWLDIVQAYSSVAIHFDRNRSTFANVVERLQGLDWSGGVVVEPTRHVTPCCYELGPNLEHVARVVGLSPDEVVRSHCKVDYTVYAIGFCPGFPSVISNRSCLAASRGCRHRGKRSTGECGTDRAAAVSTRASGRLESHRKTAVSPGRRCGELLSTFSRRPCPIRRSTVCTLPHCEDVN